MSIDINPDYSPDAAEIDGVVKLLRGLAKHEHSDHSIGSDAADLIEALAHDARRLDWLADRDNQIGSVLLPRECIERNFHSMRAAIDAAMKLPREEPEA